MLIDVERLLPPEIVRPKEKIQITSVGVLVHEGELRRGGKPNFIFLEQLDQPNLPWGIPAGHVQDYETHPYQTAYRETLEETGFKIKPKTLKVFLLSEPPKGNIIYSYQTNFNWFRKKYNFRDTEGMFISEEYVNPPEIGRIAIINSFHLFDRGHSVVQDYYRWDIMHDIKAKLEGLYVI